MKSPLITSPAARVAFALLSVMWTVTGWYLVLTKTFSTSPIRSKSITTVTGVEVQFLGLIFVALGLIAMTILLQSLSLRRGVQWLVLVVSVVAPPLLLKVVLDGI